MKGTEAEPQVAVVLVARGAIAAAPRAEMEGLAQQVSDLPGVAVATYAFTEQGLPPLREVVAELRGGPTPRSGWCPSSSRLNRASARG